MTEVVKLLSQLVKVCSVVQGSAVKFKANFDEDMLNKLKSKQLVELLSRLSCLGATS
jgi:hypothetical protein